MNRKLDNLGRIVLPLEIRQNLEINQGDEIDIEIMQDDEIGLRQIVLTKSINRCTFCGESDGLATLHSKHICTMCIKHLKNFVV